MQVRWVWCAVAILHLNHPCKTIGFTTNCPQDWAPQDNEHNCNISNCCCSYSKIYPCDCHDCRDCNCKPVDCNCKDQNYYANLVTTNGPPLVALEAWTTTMAKIFNTMTIGDGIGSLIPLLSHAKNGNIKRPTIKPSILQFTCMPCLWSLNQSRLQEIKMFQPSLKTSATKIKMVPYATFLYPWHYQMIITVMLWKKSRTNTLSSLKALQEWKVMMIVMVLTAQLTRNILLITKTDK